MSMKLSDTDLELILEWTKSLALRAGKVIQEGAHVIQSASGSNINEKKNSVDLVTEYDVKVEELVKHEISEKYPSFKFVGEESWSAGHQDALTDDPTFCVDPIDGTTNFCHGFPFYCISLGLIYERRPVLGVVYNPSLDQLYYALKGHGSYLLNGSSPNNPIRLPISGSPKPLASLSQALIAVEWGSDRSVRTLKSKTESFTHLVGNPAQEVKRGKMAHNLRSMGSAALNYCLVAQGGLDIYWEIGTNPWDVCAGIVIAQEAGGVVTGSHKLFESTKDTDALWDVTEDVLVGRKYVVIRGISDSEACFCLLSLLAQY
ncbi:hypothetical protein DL96DRAFT_1572618 [Flagelloscypha sp. PMI_526]|nr:hypothetical protein DL96DRAFT_1572618 [Flagelloscypha sp. PMI_526]